PPPYTRNFMPPTPDLSFTGLDEFVNKPVVENSKAMSSEEEPKGHNPQMDLPGSGVIDKGCSRQHDKETLSYHTKIEVLENTNFKFYETISGVPVSIVTILNTIDHLGKFDGKADEGFFVGYSLNSKAFRVFNSGTMIVEENLHIRFSESTPNVVGTQSNGFTDPKISQDDGSKPSSDDEKKVDEYPRKDNESIDQEKDDNVNSTNNVNAASTNEVNVIEADMNNLDTTIQVSLIPTTIIHKDHPLNQVIRDLKSATQTRNMSKNLEEHGFVSTIQPRTNHKDLQNCLFACFLSHEEPKKVIHALKDPSWIEAMQEELLQFKLQEVWTLVDLPNGKRAIGTKWVFRNKKDERGIVIRNKVRLVAQGYT
ncbi:putative ribonuclease H-like domain-containing protein, partial [Tanacetum coccineum]